MKRLPRMPRPVTPGPASAVRAGARAGRAARAARAGRAGLAGLAAHAGLAALLLTALAGCAPAADSSHSAGSGHPASSSQFGGYPSFLPRSTLNYHSDAVLTGTVRRPALTNEGDGVKAETTRWSVLVTVTGPQVPGEGLPYQAPATTCTWVITMSGATGAVPISASDFTSIDDLGHVYRPVLVPGQPKPPTTLLPGKTVSFELRAVEATGEGLMRWAPDGRNIVARWDFVVEND
jgi:hypothetical protein